MTAATLLGSVSPPHPPAIIIMRGHCLDMVQDMVIDQPQVTYLEKPFAMEALYAALAACQRSGEPRSRGAPFVARPSSYDTGAPRWMNTFRRPTSPAWPTPPPG